MTAVHVRSLALLVCAVLLRGPAVAAAQDISVPLLSAAFVANFAKFADWPREAVAPGRVFTFCVVADKSVKAALAESIRQHPGRDGPVTVVLVAADGPFEPCHLLYLGGMDLRQSGRVLEAVKGAAIFTVGDVDGFAELGGIAELWLDKQQMRFRINPAAAQRAHVALSARLLDLATLVKDGKNASR
jgi:hypothetical protein